MYSFNSCYAMPEPSLEPPRWYYECTAEEEEDSFDDTDALFEYLREKRRGV